MQTYLKASRQMAEDASGGDVGSTVREMLADIACNRDEAIKRYARKLDGWDGADFRVARSKIEKVVRQIPSTFKEDFEFARKQITEFAKRQRESLSEFEVELGSGITLGQRIIPVKAVGCYIPGGKYPLISAAIMSIGTAKTAGVETVIACAPPRDSDGIYPYSLYAMDACGADEIYEIGGVQALASMAYGCLGMTPVDMIVGPGNAFVSEAKRELFGVVGIDLLAGPTEICVIADSSADPSLVAADLLGQAEHGPDSPAWLITTSSELGEAVLKEVELQLRTLPSSEIARKAWVDRGEVVVVGNDDEAIAVSDEYAPEHLEVMTRNLDYYLARLRNYGSLFLGEESTVAYGDKAVGTNHTLPTGKAARYTGGLSVGTFTKTVTYQRLTRAASYELAPIVSHICEAEGMPGHQLTADIRHARYGAK